MESHINAFLARRCITDFLHYTVGSKQRGNLLIIEFYEFLQRNSHHLEPLRKYKKKLSKSDHLKKLCLNIH